MAELDIKEIWSKGQQKVAKENDIDIDRVVGEKSKSVLNTVNLILKIEFWLNNLITLPCIFWYYFEFGPIWSYITGVFYVVYFFYYLFLIRSINRFDYAGEVKRSLQKIYGYLRFYVLHYRVMIWICFVLLPYLGFAYGIYIGSTGQESALAQGNVPDWELTKQQAYMVIAAVIIVPILIAIGFNALVGLLYGRRIKKLKKMIHDLD